MTPPTIEVFTVALEILLGPPEILLGPPEILLGPPEFLLGPLEVLLGPLEIVLGPQEILLGPLKVSTDRDAGASAAPTGASPHIEETTAQASLTWVLSIKVWTGEQVHAGV
jgi:hypothetical protein